MARMPRTNRQKPKIANQPAPPVTGRVGGGSAGATGCSSWTGGIRLAAVVATGAVVVTAGAVVGGAVVATVVVGGSMFKHWTPSVLFGLQNGVCAVVVVDGRVVVVVSSGHWSWSHSSTVVVVTYSVVVVTHPL
jgi:hypothetical protein